MAAVQAARDSELKEHTLAMDTMVAEHCRQLESLQHQLAEAARADTAGEIERRSREMTAQHEAQLAQLRQVTEVELATLRKSVEDAQHQYHSLEQQSQVATRDYEARLTIVNNELNASQQYVEQLKVELATAQQQHQSTDEQQNQLRSQLTVAVAREQQLASQVQSLEHQLLELRNVMDEAARSSATALRELTAQWQVQLSQQVEQARLDVERLGAEARQREDSLQRRHETEVGAHYLLSRFICTWILTLCASCTISHRCWNTVASCKMGQQPLLN